MHESLSDVLVAFAGLFKLNTMDTLTAKKLEIILSGYNVTMQDRDSIIDLMDEYLSQSQTEYIKTAENMAKERAIDFGIYMEGVDTYLQKKTIDELYDEFIRCEG